MRREAEIVGLSVGKEGSKMKKELRWREKSLG